MKRNVTSQSDFDEVHRNYLVLCAESLEQIVGSHLEEADVLALAHAIYEHRIELRSGLVINPEVDSDRELSKGGAAAIAGSLAAVNRTADEWRLSYIRADVGKSTFIQRYRTILAAIAGHENTALVV